MGLDNRPTRSELHGTGRLSGVKFTPDVHGEGTNRYQHHRWGQDRSR